MSYSHPAMSYEYVADSINEKAGLTTQNDNYLQKPIIVVFQLPARDPAIFLASQIAAK